VSRSWLPHRAPILLLAAACAPAGDPPPAPVGPESNSSAAVEHRIEAGSERCRLSANPDTLHVENGAVLLRWDVPDDPVYYEPILPADSAFLAYRAAVRADGADVRWPIADAPTPRSDAEADLWRDERFNADLARSGEAGKVGRITCLESLLFALQNRRVPQLAEPTEFLASVLRREREQADSLVVLFGAGEALFPPKSVYGFDVVEKLVKRGWRWSFALHNHTIQRKDDHIALGTPALSTSDVQLSRNLAADLGLEAARVTNGFFTYRVSADQFGRLRSR
jgi:hypothetical protein